METQEHFFQCPYCWQMISMILDLSVPDQEYVEDCEGCCAPIALRYRVAEQEITEFEASPVQP